jgi:pilus assembly protein Flp/PilA
MRRQLTKARWSRLFRRFRADRRGVTAIEFAFLGGPFILLMVMIVETAMLFWSRQVLQEATSQVSRAVLTGESRKLFTGSTTEQGVKFRDAVCARMDIKPSDCPTKIFIDVLPMNAFPGSVSSMVSGGAIDPATFAFRPTNPEQIVVIRTAYKVPVFFAGYMSTLSRLPTGENVLESVVAFRTEPYPTS